MKIILPIVEFYDHLFKNYVSEGIISNFNHKEKLLFNNILNGKTKTDKQASTNLYDGNPSGQAYSKMKQILLTKLMQIVINIENNQASLHRKKVLNLYKDYHAYLILSNSSMSQVSKIIGKKIILQAERLCEYNIGMDVSKKLATNYYINSKNKSEGSKFWKKYDFFEKAYKNHNNIIKDYSELMLYVNKNNYSQQIHSKAKSLQESYLPHIDKNNFHFMRFYFQLGYLKHAILDEHKGVIENNLEALDFFENFRFKHIPAMDLLKVQLVVSYLAIGELDKAVEYLSIDTSIVSDEKWINKISLKIRIYFTLQKYDKANELIESSISSFKFKQSRPVFKELLWLYKYYNDLMQSFLHDIPVNSRKIKNNLTRIQGDKQGLNIPLIIADTILKIQKSGIISIYSKMDSLKSYMKSHLNKNENKRSITFIRFLLSLPNSKYDPDKFLEQLAEVKAEFEENPAEISTGKAENEIIPYEYLMYSILEKYLPKESQNRQNIQNNSASGHAVG